MTNQVKEAIRKIAELPPEQQEEIAILILEELSWEQAFSTTQDQLLNLAKEASKEYKSGQTKDDGW